MVNIIINLHKRWITFAPLPPHSINTYLQLAINNQMLSQSWSF